jgi:hypothetical protein
VAETLTIELRGAVVVRTAVDLTDDRWNSTHRRARGFTEALPSGALRSPACQTRGNRPPDV